MDISNRLLKVRRRIASFSLGMLVASLLVTAMAQAQTFTDVQPGDWFYSYVEQGVSEGWINGSFSEFRPGDQTNRYEAAMVIYKAFGFDANPSTKTTPSFTDAGYGPGHWAFTAVETLVENGVVSGYNNTEGQPTGKFGGADPVTRIQYAKMVKRGAPLTTVIMDSAPNFPDVSVTHPLYEDWESAYAWSVINGYPDGTGKPNNNIIRAEIAAMTARALNPVLRAGAGFEVESAAATALNKVEVCFSTEPGEGAEDASNYMIVEGADGTTELDVMSVALSTDPDCVVLTTANQTAGKNYEVTVTDVMSVTGEELMANADPVSFTGYKGGVVGGDLTCAPGTQPAGVAVPKGATGVNFVVVDCTAGSKSVVMSSMSFHRFGAGDEGDFDDVYLYADDNRITTGRSINSETQMVEFSGLNYEIMAGDTVSFWIAGDIAVLADSASQHGFELLNADAIESNAQSVDLASAVQGNLFTISGATAGIVTIERNGSLDEVTIGETARISQFLLSASGSEAMKLSRMALYVRGTCDSDDVSDFDLMVEGSNEVLAHADNVGAKDLVSFVLENPYVISQGNSKVFYVMATNACRNNETIKTYLDETTDLHVTGVTFGTGVRVNNNYDGTGTQFSEVTVKGSDFTVAFNGPDAGDIAVGQKLASCMDLTITNVAGTDVEIKDWDVTLAILNATTNAGGLVNTDATPNEANYSLIKLVAWNEDGGMTTLLGPSELNVGGNDVSQPVTLAGSKIIKSGESMKASIIMDVANNTAVNSDKLRCTLTDLTTDGADYVRDLNGDALGAESITPATNITGNTFTLSSAGLTFAVASTPSSRTYVSGANNAELLGLTVTSGSSLSNTVKSITLQGYVDCNTAGTVFGKGTATVATHCAGETAGTNLKDVVDSLALYDGATMVSTLKNVNASDGKVIFNNLNIVVPKSTTVNLKLVGHINNSAPYGSVSDRVAFSIDNQSDIIAIDSNGQNVNTGSINIDNAVNDGSDEVNDKVMTIASGGSGTTTEQGSLARSIMTGNSPEIELAKFKFTSDNEDVSLRKITLGTMNRNGASLQYVKLFTGANCATPVKLLGGSDSGEFSSIGSSGVFQIQGLNLTIADAGDTFLCVKGKTPSVSASGDPISGDNVGIVLLDIPEIISGNGTNVSEKYIGTDIAHKLAAVMASDDTIMLLDDTAPALGDVVVIDQEQILITNDGAAPEYVVARGFGRTTPAAHAAGESVYLSTLTSGANGSDSIATNNPSVTDTTLDVTTPADYSVGSVLALFETNSTTFEYALVTATGGTAVTGSADFTADDDIKVVRGMFGTTVLDLGANANIIFLTERGSLFPLRASVPTLTNVPVTGGAVGAGTYTLLKFDVAATGENNVTFMKGATDDYNGTTDSLLSVQLYGSTEGGEIGVCTLRNVTDNEILDTANLTTVNISGNAPTSIDVHFNFSTKSLVVAPGNKKTLEVQCDLNIEGGSGRSVSARIVEDANAAGGDWIGSGDADATAYDVVSPSVVVYSDGDDTTVDEAGTLIDNLPLFGPSFNSTAT